MVACAVLKSEPKSEMSVKLHSNIISGATDGLVYAMALSSKFRL
jgi:hypothetical protein